MDISSLRERKISSDMTVSELNQYVKNLFDNDKSLKAVSVKGEISNLTKHSSGHIYFTLKDEGAQVKAVMFRSSALGLKFVPENGMKVIVRAGVNVYVSGGSYQLYVTSIQPDGIGALYLAYEQLKAKLELEGLFDVANKRKLPMFPSAVGVITSPTGAAIRDIINVLGRRYPLSKVYLYPALVQGEGAESSLIKGIEYFDSSSLVDVVIIGRGGGSIEDLWAFNSEKLARRIYSSHIPIISAVGHETDFTICDFVSDKRAPTPSAAAEIAVPDIRELAFIVNSLKDRSASALKANISGAEDELRYLSSCGIFTNTDALFSSKEEILVNLYEKASDAVSLKMKDYDQKMALIYQKLDDINPLSVLSRGYSVVSTNGRTLRNCKDVEVGDDISVRLRDGEILAKVKEKVTDYGN